MRKTLLLSAAALAIAAGAASATDYQIQWNSTVNGAWNDMADMTPANPNDPVIRVMKRDLTNGQGQNAFVDQVGEGNALEIDQKRAGGGAIADVIQIGSNNQTDVAQTTSGNRKPGDYAVSTTVGERNGVLIKQNNTGDFNYGKNYADVQQGSDDRRDGIPDSRVQDSVASINQNGEGNKADINQYEGAGRFATANEASIAQVGDDNNARMDQDGDYHRASIEQKGDYNEASTYQAGSGNEASVAQIGDYNDAEVSQRGQYNVALLKQNGDYNNGLIRQNGDFNKAGIDQDGDFNSANIAQDGLGNDGLIRQTGDANKAALEQSGRWNTASIRQNGHDFANVQQHGYSNSAVVSQGN